MSIESSFHTEKYRSWTQRSSATGQHFVNTIAPHLTLELRGRTRGVIKRDGEAGVLRNVFILNKFE